MKSVHLIKKKMESGFCVADATSVADATFAHYMLGLPIILNHIKVISFSINHSTLVQHYGNKIVFVLLLWWRIAMCRGRYTFFRTKNFPPKNTNGETRKFFHEKILIMSLFTCYSAI